MDDHGKVTEVFEANQEEIPRVGIIILNWNNFDDTANCLATLQENVEYSNYRVYVVDNGSQDGSGERIEEEFDWCDVIKNEENLGFAAGNNVGIKKALEQEADYVLLLNNDVVVSSPFLNPLVKTAEKHAQTAIVGGLIKYADSDDLWFAGGEFRPTLVRANRVTKPSIEAMYETDHVVGALMLFSGDFLQQHGLLEEKYFFGLEDTEICYRASKHGWNIFVNSTVHVEHDVSSTAGHRTPFKYYHATRNRLQFAKDHLDLPRSTIFYLFFSITRILRAVQWLPRNRRLITATLRGIYDHMLKKYHKKPEYFNL